MPFDNIASVPFSIESLQAMKRQCTEWKGEKIKMGTILLSPSDKEFLEAVERGDFDV